MREIKGSLSSGRIEDLVPDSEGAGGGLLDWRLASTSAWCWRSGVAVGFRERGNDDAVGLKSRGCGETVAAAGVREKREGRPLLARRTGRRARQRREESRLGRSGRTDVPEDEVGGW